MIAICTIAIMLSGGYRDYQQVRGTIIDDNHDFWTVDFSEEFKKRGINTDEEIITLEHTTGPARFRIRQQTPVQRINGNDCKYENPPKEWLE